MYTVVYEIDSRLRWITFPAQSFAEVERACSDYRKMIPKGSTIISISLHSQSTLSFGNGIHLSHYLKDER